MLWDRLDVFLRGKTAMSVDWRIPSHVPLGTKEIYHVFLQSRWGYKHTVSIYINIMSDDQSQIYNYLVVEPTDLKNSSQIGSFPQGLG